MKRRHFLKTAAAIPVVWSGCSSGPCCRWAPRSAFLPRPSRRSRLALPLELGEVETGGPRPIDRIAFAAGRVSGACWCRMHRVLQGAQESVLHRRRPRVTQTSGWLARGTRCPASTRSPPRARPACGRRQFRPHAQAAVGRQRGRNSYQGTSNAPDSLLIWTRRMHDIVLHDAFVPIGSAGKIAPQPAVTVGGHDLGTPL